MTRKRWLGKPPRCTRLTPRGRVCGRVNCCTLDGVTCCTPEAFARELTRRATATTAARPA